MINIELNKTERDKIYLEGVKAGLDCANEIIKKSGYEIDFPDPNEIEIQNKA